MCSFGQIDKDEERQVVIYINFNNQY